MKKVLILSGAAAFALLVLLLTGFSDADDAVKKAMRQGNASFGSAAYQEALSYYETGLAASSEDKELNFNAAQAAYLLGEYERAMDYYEKSGDTVEKFLNTGNTFFMIGNSLEDSEQKLQCYMQALKYYYDGIVLFPRNVPLKYNYEAVKGLADDLLKDMDQQSSDQSDGDDSQEQDGQEQDGQEQDSQEQDGQEQDGQEQDGASAEQDQDESPDAQSQADEGEDADGEESGAQEQDDGEDAGRDAISQDDEGIELDREAIERILRMLESQERESLKNNQEVIGGKDGKYGW